MVAELQILEGSSTGSRAAVLGPPTMTGPMTAAPFVLCPMAAALVLKTALWPMPVQCVLVQMLVVFTKVAM